MASSPALNMQTPNSPQSNYATASPSSGCSSSYMTAISPSSVVSDDDDITMISHQQMANVANQLLHISPPYYWATISYYELNTRVGDAFKIQGKVIVVDGFTDPTECDSRICLGLITNVNRNSTIENTRKHIGRGLRLECSPDHNITLTNLSEASIFVQSRNCNIKMSQDPTSVQRIPPGGSCTVFDNSLFTNVHSFNFEFEFITHGNWVVRYRKGVFHVRGNMRSKELKTYEVEGVHVDFGKNFRVIGHSYSSGSIVWEGGEGLGRYSFKVSNSSLKPDCILPT